MENNYRVHTNINSDTVLKVNFKQDIDFLEVLSLKISQEDTYVVKNSNYGIIVGRVLANDAFGIPNARVSVFIELSEDDTTKTDIINLYKFKTTNDKDKNNVRYNLLPDDSDDDCYRLVGTFPNKRLVLDDTTVLEVFDKYYKYTTVTNNSGDYMLYGIPTGSTMLHVDIDLSDIGVLSQKPRDFMYKGYNETQFDNANQFKESTNLDNLSQIISQNQGVYVYPFFGEEGSEDVAITRCDIQVQYKFEPTCVFFGAIMSDSFGNNIGCTCTPSKYSGRNSELVCGNGTIEMIRKTIGGETEEYQIQGNQLIDGDGVWCYQIPMNLDYVGTDEFGNICATDNPNKGIPTRTRVRFRFTMTETENDAVSRHRAKYLVPNNPRIMSNTNVPHISACSVYDKHYNFGSSTQDDDYRDLYWNKVYSVKNYIPRLQTIKKPKTYNHTGLRTTNMYQSKNPIPFNKARFRLPFTFMLLCVIVKVVISTIYVINTVLCTISSAFALLCRIKIWKWRPFGFACSLILPCIAFGAGLTDSDDSNTAFYPGCWLKESLNKSSCPDDMSGCKKVSDTEDLFDIVEQSLAQEYDVIHLDFYNDWLNGSLYFPLWHWKKKRKKSFFFGLFRKKAKNSYCEVDRNGGWSRLRIMDSCTLPYLGPNTDNGDKWHNNRFDIKIKWGIIKNIINKDGLNLYYYSAGNIIDDKPNENNGTVGKEFVRLFATDIILLGSFNECDLEGLPQPFNNLPSTTANIPAIARIVAPKNDDDDTATEGTTEEEGDIEITGMDWLHGASKTSPKYVNGLLLGLDCTEIYTKPKSCINVGRLSELGVNYDMTVTESFLNNGAVSDYLIEPDGIINKIELDDYETRAMFATLNHNGLDKLKIDEKTGYKIYDLRYTYPVDFDGRFKQTILNAYQIETSDNIDEDYKAFKYGPDYEYNKSGVRTIRTNDRITHNYGYENIASATKNDFFPLFNNSFYFYFGLNEGKTAIEKFRKKFTATCFKNVKFPFSIEIDKEASKYCIKDTNNGHTSVDVDSETCQNSVVADRCGVIEVTLSDIKKPYSYNLFYATSGDKIIGETNLTLEKLIFGVELIGNQKYNVVTAKTDGCYESSSGVIYKKNGKFNHFTNYTEYVKSEDGTPVFIDNNIYKLVITDANGKTQTETITLMQMPIQLNYTSNNLGTKFIPVEEQDVYDNKEYGKFTIACDLYHSENYGDVNINSISIDGEEYDIKTCYYIGTKGVISDIRTYDCFLLHVVNKLKTTESYDVELKIGVKKLLFEDDIRFAENQPYGDKKTWSFLTHSCDGFNDFTRFSYNKYSDTVLKLEHSFLDSDTDNEIHNGETITTHEFSGGKLIFKVWVPGTYEFILTQFECGSLNTNSSTNVITIGNGQIFDAFLNDVPLRFLDIEPEKGDGVITTLHPEGYYISGKENQDSPRGWHTINQEEKTYHFPSICNNEALWSSYINYTPTYITEGEKLIKVCNATTKLNALIFKFQSIFNLSKAVYFDDNGNNTFKFTVKGGKQTVKQAYFPAYSEFTDATIYPLTDTIDFTKSKLNKWTLTKDTTVTCDSCHPNIVASNYRIYNAFCLNDKETYPSNKETSHSKYGGFTEYNSKDLTPFMHIIEPSIDVFRDYGYGFNPLFTDNDNTSIHGKAVNYFAAFTNNGANKCERFPNNTNTRPILNGDSLLTFESKNRPPSEFFTKNLSYWFKTEFIDRRIGYQIAIFTSSPSLKNLNNSEISPIAASGRVALTLNGGIELAYYDGRPAYDNYHTNLFDIIQKIKREDESNAISEYYYFVDDICTNTNDIKTYYNTNYNNVWKLFYKAMLNLDNQEYDIRHGLYNRSYKGGDISPYYASYNNSTSIASSKIIDEISSVSAATLYMNLVQDDVERRATGYYDSPSKDSYPPKRYMDLIGVDILKNFSLNITNCNYETSLTTLYPDEFKIDENDTTDDYMSQTQLQGIISEGSHIDVNIGCNNTYQFSTSDIDKCVQTGNYNVLCLYNDDGYVPSYMRISVKMTEDTSTSLNYTIMRPFSMKFKTIKELNNAILDIKFTHASDKSHYAPYDAYEYTLNTYESNITLMKMYQNDTISNGLRDYDTTDLKKYKYLYSTDDDGHLLLKDSDSDVYNDITLYLNGETVDSILYFWKYTDDTVYGKTNAVNIKNANNLMIFGGREYFDTDSSSLLERDVRLFDCSQIYTFEPFNLDKFHIIGSVSEAGEFIPNTTMHDIVLTFMLNGVVLGDTYNSQLRGKIWYVLKNSTVFGSSTMQSVNSEVEASYTKEESETKNLITMTFSVTDDELLMIKEYGCYIQFFFTNVNKLVYGLSFSIKGKIFGDKSFNYDINETDIDFN